MIEVLCTLIGIIAGIAVVVSIAEQHRQSNGLKARRQSSAGDEDRIKKIASRLQMLSQQVSADVVTHTETVARIKDTLLLFDNSRDSCLEAISQLVEANEAIQRKLAESQNKMAEQQFQIRAASVEARVDTLTGLGSRYALDEVLSKCILCLQPGEPVALLMLDVDRFDEVNQRYGTEVGDAALAGLGVSLAKWCEGKFFVARYEGDKLVVIIAEESTESIVRVAETLRAHLSSVTIRAVDCSLNLKLSGGLTQLLTEDSLEQVYERAIEGIYHAKKNGRDRGFWLHSGAWKNLASAVTDVSACEQARADLQVSK
jgi:diguanylate cyclase (GGDEF)-like protein